MLGVWRNVDEPNATFVAFSDYVGYFTDSDRFTFELRLVEWQYFQSRRASIHLWWSNLMSSPLVGVILWFSMLFSYANEPYLYRSFKVIAVFAWLWLIAVADLL